ncbi:MAG: type III secretion inner membrane ring lipoprotein SctJ [Pseudomonadota bacterium]
MQWLRSKLLLLCTLFALAGCQEVLYSELSEEDANEMVALLVLSGIPASRQNDAGSGYSVLVEEADIAVAVTVLKNSGLPRAKFASMGEIFGDVGVVGTPFEERVRFAYATNQELSNTISQIKGVDNARVHVVIPEKKRFGSTDEPASASVAIFHDRSFEPSSYSPRIKTLIAFAVPDLAIENISLSFFLSPGFVVQPQLEAETAPGAAMAQGYNLPGGPAAFPFFGALLFLVLLFVVRLVMLAWRRVG